MATIIQLRRDTAARWTASNPILAQGEAGLETDTNKLKFGDGVTAWTSLAYFTGDAPVKSVNTKTGVVVLSASDVGAVPTTRTVNSKALSSDVTLAAGDVGAVPTSRTVNSKALSSDITLNAGDVGAVPTSRTINSKALSSDVTLAAGDVGAVPTTRTVNNKALSSDITLSAGDVGAVSDVQINSTSIVSDGVANIPVADTSNLGVVKVNSSYGTNITAEGLLYVARADSSDINGKSNNYKPIVPSTLNYAVRSVYPACTTITASDTTATLTANTTYAHALSSSGCTYTLTTPTDLTVYSGFILMIDTTNSASVAFQTDDSPTPTSIVLNGNPTISTGKRYTVTGQYSVLNNAWELWIIEYNAS